MSLEFGKFDGGIDLPAEKDTTLKSPITALPKRLSRLRIPLSPYGGTPAEPVIQQGRSIAAGERIASGPGDGTDIFAPVSGTIQAVVDVLLPLGTHWVESTALEMLDIGDPPSIPPHETQFDWEQADADEFQARIAEGQLLTCHRRCRPLIQWLIWVRNAGCRILILNAMEDQPFVTAHHRLLVEYGHEVISGLAILARATGIHGANTIIAVDQEYANQYPDLEPPTAGYSMNMIALERKYPVGADNLLVKVLTNREVPCGATPGDIRVAVIDPATCFAAYRWVACGQRLPGRVITVGGDRHARPGNYFIPYGALCSDIVKPSEPPYVIGGPMTGLQWRQDSVISPTTDAVLAITQTPSHISTQCIRCAWCRDHCPARLNVAVLNDFFELGQHEKTERLGILSCVNCGICSYVCPARLPLAERMSDLATALRNKQNRMPLFSTPFPP